MSLLARRADAALAAAGVLMICGGVPACWAYSGWRFATGHPHDGWVYLFLAPLVLAFCGYMLAILPWASGSAAERDAAPSLPTRRTSRSRPRETGPTSGETTEEQ